MSGDWPAGLDPATSPVYARNTLDVPADPAWVWARLVDAQSWPDWYANARRVRLRERAALDGAGRAVLGPGTVFTWVTFGVPVRCEITEWEPHRLLGWSGTGPGARGHHRWELTGLVGGGTRAVTEEVQAGPVPTVAAPVLRRGLLHWHQRWLAGL